MEAGIEVVDIDWEGNGGYTAQGFFTYDETLTGVIDENQLSDFVIDFFTPGGDLIESFDYEFPVGGEFNFNYNTATGKILQSGNFDDLDNGFDLGIDFDIGETGTEFYSDNENFTEVTVALEDIITAS